MKQDLFYLYNHKPGNVILISVLCKIEILYNNKAISLKRCDGKMKLTILTGELISKNVIVYIIYISKFIKNFRKLLLII